MEQGSKERRRGGGRPRGNKGVLGLREGKEEGESLENIPSISWGDAET